MIHQKVAQFINTRFRAAIGSRAIDDDTPLFSSGIVDSFGVLELMAFLEEAFGVEIDPGRHELAEFDTIGKVASLVARLQGPSGPTA